MDKLNQPHDKYFKATFGEVSFAKDFLSNYLPEELVDMIDMNTLESQPTSYISEELKEQFTDLLFRVNIMDKEAYIYFLFEHKSYRDRMVIFQVLKYKDINLVIRSLGPIEADEYIMEVSKYYGINNRVNILEPTNPQIVKLEQKNAFINLVVEDLDTTVEWKKGTLTGKFLELIVYSLPVLAIARTDSEIGEILSYTRKGRLCSTVDEIDEFLGKVNENSTGYWGVADSIESYSKQNQAKQLCKFLDNFVE